MKKFAKIIIVTILGWQVRRLRRRHQFKVVAVAGSIGKTSTKFAIATVLSQGFRVRFQAGNYNDLASVPLTFFDLPMPTLFNPIAWLKTFVKVELQLHRVYPVDVVVVELGTDGPGQLQNFKKYIHADIGVLTAIAPEHMEFFTDLDAVAIEELSIAALSDKLLINKDLCAEKYVAEYPDAISYAAHTVAQYQLVDLTFDEHYSFRIKQGDSVLINAKHESIAETQLYSLTAAVATADQLGMSSEQMLKGLEAIKPVSGRMQRLEGIKNSVILDDTYNASPEATKAALDTLYKLPAAHKIAILGNMNELGRYSEQAHTDVGAYCDPLQLEMVITIGPDANHYLAAAAEQKGCSVERFDSPYRAGEFLKDKIQENTLILAKGSQNGVFAEETVKLLLLNPEDATKLVRQSSDWLQKKMKVFAQ